MACTRRKMDFSSWESFPRPLHVILSFLAYDSFPIDPFRSRSESITRHLTTLNLLHEHGRCLYRYSSAVAQNAGPLLVTLSGA